MLYYHILMETDDASLEVVVVKLTRVENMKKMIDEYLR
jgi:hypothetical protein